MDKPIKLQLQGAAKVLSQQSKAKAARGKAQLGASLQMEPLSSAAANVTHDMEMDDKDLPEDDVTVIAEAEETDYESG